MKNRNIIMASAAGLVAWLLFWRKGSTEPPPPPPETGIISISVLPVDVGTVNVSVDGEVVGAIIAGSPLEVEVLAGSYTVSFSAVSGWITPETVTVTVVVGEASQARGVYTPVAANYTLSIFVGGSGTTSPSGGGSYPAGTVVQVTAYPAPGWQIDHWENAATGSNPTVSITMSNNKTLVIIFMVEPAQLISFTLNATNLPTGGIYYWGGIWESLDGFTYFPPLQPVWSPITYTNVPSQGLFSVWLGDYSGNALPGYPEYWGGFDLLTGGSVTANFANKRLER